MSTAAGRLAAMKKTLALLALLLVASVPSSSSYNTATGNGATTVFAFTFQVTTSATHVQVVVNEVVQSSGFSTFLNANQASSPGGTVTFTVAPTNGAALRIQRLVPITQETVLPSYGQYRAKDVEKGLDRLAYEAQQLQRRLDVDQDARDDAQELALSQAILGSYGWQRVVATVDTSNNSTAAATDVTGLFFPCASGKRYLVRAVIFGYAALDTTGMGISAKAAGAPTTTDQFVAFEGWTETGAFVLQRSQVFLDTPGVLTGSNSANPDAPAPNVFHGHFRTTSIGTFQLRLITEVNASAVTVKAGSYLEWMEFP